ncbi:hypothetical protein E2C01_043279 [Portunus trituberculatus]|uniref:Secreted protein n=1 Tax=Portunus trituberculatus TaxID=210409 RepID=A0A5B7FVP1_PORTR|nr:hypothetical protein [Portunus trituberculatus]
MWLSILRSSSTFTTLGFWGWISVGGRGGTCTEEVLEPRELLATQRYVVASSLVKLRMDTTGCGNPLALHVSVTELPSSTIVSPEVALSTISGGTTTSRCAICRGKEGRWWCQYPHSTGVL